MRLVREFWQVQGPLGPWEEGHEINENLKKKRSSRCRTHLTSPRRHRQSTAAWGQYYVVPCICGSRQ